MSEECKDILSKLESIIIVRHKDMELIATAMELIYTIGLRDGLKDSMDDLARPC